jgi:hypothetical protein
MISAGTMNFTVFVIQTTLLDYPCVIYAFLPSFHPVGIFVTSSSVIIASVVTSLFNGVTRSWIRWVTRCAIVDVVLALIHTFVETVAATGIAVSGTFDTISTDFSSRGLFLDKGNEDGDAGGNDGKGEKG